MNRIKAYFAESPAQRWPRLAIKRKPLSWVRFSWDLSSLPETASFTPEHYQIERATSEDEAALAKVFSASYMLDPVWSPAIGDVMRKVQDWLNGALVSDNRICLTLRHGSRVIGASLLHLNPEAEDQLAPGPTVSLEYRNRGFGALLLEHSLRALGQAGHRRASGITRDLSPAAKFLYPKFGGVFEPIDSAALAAA